MWLKSFFKTVLLLLQENDSRLINLAPPSPNLSLPQPQYSTQITEVISTEIFLNSPSPNRSRRTSVEAKIFHSTHLRRYTLFSSNFADFWRKRFSAIKFVVCIYVTVKWLKNLISAAKRKRRANWSKEEKIILIEEVFKFEDRLFGKIKGAGVKG